jgi:hypothetical protein
MKRLCLGLVLAIAACGGGKKTSSPTTTAPARAEDPSCPLEVPGTSVSVEDTPNGAALVFVTTGDPLAVRARAAKLADMHTKHDGGDSAMGMMFPSEWKAVATEVEGGARVEFDAPSADGVAKLQSELRMHAGHLQAGTCEM